MFGEHWTLNITLLKTTIIFYPCFLINLFSLRCDNPVNDG